MFPALVVLLLRARVPLLSLAGAARFAVQDDRYVCLACGFRYEHGGD
jgi:hypothetical protein